MPLAIDGMKECNRCKVIKPVSEFYKRSASFDGVQSKCRLCQNEEKKVYRKNNKEHLRLKRNWLYEYKRVPCTDCGKTYPPQIMDFDHVPERGPKLFKVSGGNGHRTKQEVADELAKCDVVCPTCHRIRTVTRAGLLTEEELDVLSKL